MEFGYIGKCNDCTRSDYLPRKCNDCNMFYCDVDFIIHSCKEEIRIDHPLNSNKFNTKKCSQCNKRFLSNSIECSKCNKLLCLEHRYQDSHRCITIESFRSFSEFKPEKCWDAYKCCNII